MTTGGEPGLIPGEFYEFYSPDAFLAAWKRGVQLAGPHFFGWGDRPVPPGATIWELRPQIAVVYDAMDYLAPGQAAFLAAMYSFYNGPVGAQMMQMANEGRPMGLAELVGSLDEPRRRVIADLLISYAGW